MKPLKMLRSFKFAFRGIGRLIRYENNARFHLLFTVMVILAGFWFRISSGEWIAVITMTGLVWSGEAFNAAIEKLCDFVSPEKREIIRDIKDMAAAGVLFLAIASAIVAAVIFLPKI